MKKLLLILLLFPLLSLAQKDFDYSIYTTQLRISHDEKVKADSIQPIYVLRNFKKEGSLLHIVPIGNTGDSEVWFLKFLGFDPKDLHFLYEARRITDAEGPKVIHIKINPMDARVSMFFDKRTDIYN